MTCFGLYEWVLCRRQVCDYDIHSFIADIHETLNLLRFRLWQSSCCQGWHDRGVRYERCQHVIQSQLVWKLVLMPGASIEMIILRYFIELLENVFLASNIVAATVALRGVQTTHSMIHITPTRIQVWFFTWHFPTICSIIWLCERCIYMIVWMKYRNIILLW